jgi:hypothetical protein
MKAVASKEISCTLENDKCHLYPDPCFWSRLGPNHHNHIAAGVCVNNTMWKEQQTPFSHFFFPQKIIFNFFVLLIPTALRLEDGRPADRTTGFIKKPSVVANKIEILSGG